MVNEQQPCRCPLCRALLELATSAERGRQAAVKKRKMHLVKTSRAGRRKAAA